MLARLRLGSLALAAQVRHLWTRADILEQLVAARRSRESRHLALGIFEITEHERFRRARLHAGWLNVAVPELALLSFCLNRHRLDALHAERALLHHADRAQRDVGVELQMQRLVP